MQFDVSQEPPPRYATYDSALAQFEREVIQRVNDDLGGQGVVEVYDALVTNLHGRLPGIEFDEGNLWAVAGAISRGTFPHQVW
jgi:hypothetical protein